MSETLKEAQKNLTYLIEEDRRKTFKKWVFSKKDTCNADKMAEAGFVFTGNKIDRDVVKCFFCNKCLDGWDSTDDPWAEHLKHAPKCSFAKLQKSQDSLTLKEFLDIKNELIENMIRLYHDQQAQSIKETMEEYEEEIRAQLEKK